jgi:predicted anti-sigma-YlaC factor YlaD
MMVLDKPMGKSCLSHAAYESSNVCPHDEWLMRALEDALDRARGFENPSGLSSRERQLWQQHLALCDACRAEWEALLRVESILCDAPVPPPLSVDFTAHTMQRLVWRKRLRLGLTWLGSLITVSFVALIVLSAFGSTLSQMNQFFVVLRAGQSVLLEFLIYFITSFLILGQKILPIALAMAGALLLLMVPNGVLATYALMLVRQRHRRSALGEI